jgi:predicted HTH domain antitoxin
VSRTFVYDANIVYDMGTVSARVPEDLEAALAEYVEAENVERSTAVRQLLAEGLTEWRVDRALSALEDGRVTLSRAAELAGVTVWEMRRRADEADVTWVDDRHASADLDDL